MATKYKEYTPGTYVESEELKGAKSTADYWNNQQLQNFTFGDQDLSQGYWDTHNALNNLVKPTWAGYSKQGDWDNIYNQLSNMKDFSYDVNGDALYQQYKDQYVTGGKMAMMDTMGQAAAMTGGYGNSYAQSVGQQAYQGYLQQLNDKVPELYQLALSKYNSDKDNLFRMNDLHQNYFNNEYGMYRDNVSDYNADRTYLSGRESELYNRDYSKKYDETTSLNSNITANRSYYNDVYNTLSNSEWGKYMDNETLQQVAIQVANDNLHKEEQDRIADAELSLKQNSAGSGGGGNGGSGDDFKQYTYARSDDEGNSVFYRDGKEYTVQKGVNPYTGTKNPDAQNGTFNNGYQPNNVNGKKLSKSGITDVVNGVTQNVWKDTTGQKWIWDGTQNKYLKYEG